MGSKGVSRRTLSSGRQRDRRRPVRGRPVPIDAVDARVREPLLGAGECRCALRRSTAARRRAND